MMEALHSRLLAFLLNLGCLSADGQQEEAVANWKRLARQHCKLDGTEDDGFITVHPDLAKTGVA